ncbi:MAG: hypothetical protein COU40_03945 [Candidatus Moranbacteria bacterium CG10_big_fil_rev_8_21_14_0_10_35_21]|nr:MAG: hypothetical protein COU40_03945 [Candidatus Moranbacteria bacterium CG10_big_fil_rev_8_21_14_0_10_35_21]PJA88420.1 MAG: hypothetical protein CO139_03310 [Candidatus Moranbacteria bacterium CG_4_9_14_3_um_filter_36_9]
MSKKNYEKDSNVLLKIVIIILIIVVIGFVYEKIRTPKSSQTQSSESSDPTHKLVGKPAPEFSLTDREGNTYTNENLKGKRVVLFFNEGLMCYPACWDQMLEFPKDERFKADDIVVLSVVVDSKDSWQKAIEKMPEMGMVKAALDEGSKVSRAFGMLSVPSSMHAGAFPGHTYVVLDKDGIVRYVLDDPRMAINNGQVYVEINKLK